jgi:phosphate transport system protein
MLIGGGPVTRELYQHALAEVRDEVLALTSMAEHAVMRSVEALRDKDMDGSLEIIADDRAIDEKRYAIEANVMLIVSTQAPLASDMRALAAALFISNELERIADYGKGIARINQRIGVEPFIKPLVDIPRMAESAQEMLRNAMQAYANRDAERAMSIIPRDDEVDQLYDQVYAELMTHIMQDVSNMRQANLLLMAAHNLERTADRVTNICERVVYMATGEFVETGWHADKALEPKQ